MSRPSARASQSSRPHRTYGLNSGARVARPAARPLHTLAPRHVSLPPRPLLTPTRRAAHPLRALAVEEAVLDHSKTFKYGKGEFEISISISEERNGDQRIHLETSHPSSNLILHWGVQGGANYRGGWRLPRQQPPKTVQYKDRALQTSWNQAGDGRQVVDIALDGDEASDYINFVLKDAATNTWYDSNGSNFQMPLRSSLRSFASMDDAEMSAALFSLDEIPEIPSDLAGVWAYIKWESEGCPNRSQEEADREYRAGIAEMQACLCRGKSLAELWDVANGKVRYSDFQKSFINAGEGGPRDEAREARREAPTPRSVAEASIDTRDAFEVEQVFVPDDIVATKAYLLWEAAGRPDGADFSQQALQEIYRDIEGGASIKEIEARLRSPAKDKAPQQQQQQAPPAQKQGAVELGAPVDVPHADPLKLIKKAEVPLLSSSKKETKEKPLEFLVQAAAMDEATRFRRVYRLNDGAELLAVVSQHRGEDAADDGDVTITLTTDSANDMVLHWGVGTHADKAWSLPPSEIVPQGSETDSGGIAYDTPFEACTGDACDASMAGARVPLQQRSLVLPRGTDVANLQFVLRSSDRSMWYRDGSSNFSVPVPSRAHEHKGPVVTDPLVNAIIDAEATNAWTLMHRFNRAADLLNETMAGAYEDVPAATAAIYVWLRYSATRALTWQRNYNTQPRILSAAQDRLTGTIAEAHKNTSGEAQEWVRLMLSSVGRGGDGQAIRDEILNIMHRNKIPEKKGLWMESWHQKLHNNTTPDDVPICEAYLAFLRANGDNGAYWRVLSDAGISRARMEGFDRPIREEPDYYGDKRDALIGDFTRYLGILKAVHSGADLQNAAKNVGGSLPGSAKGHLGYVLASLGSTQILPLIQSAVACRYEMHAAVPGNRDLLYLDLALEDVVRGAAERGASTLGMGAAAFVGPLLQNLVLTAGENEELCYCLKAWQALPRSVQYGATPSTVEALQATAVVDRVRRALGELSDAIVARVQPVAETVGEGCGIENWAVDLFAEEVVRGGPAFAVSLVLSTVEPALRRCAELGSWQIISPANVTGRVVEVAALADVQDEQYGEPTILLAQRVSGEEEIPEGVVAVLTPDAPDVLSHSSVRARNMKVLLATCHEAEPLEALRGSVGAVLSFETTAAGGVTWEEADDDASGAGGNGAAAAKRPELKIDVPKWCGEWCVSMSQYQDGVVGAKSKNLAALRGELPSWIALPASVTLPFGCFEQALEAPDNADVKRRLAAATAAVPSKPAANLAECREAVMGMVIPREVRTALRGKMEEAGIPLPESEERWAEAEAALRGVWASKFNDRAYFSMRKVGLDFMDLRMAVLVQRVVPAQYAFVIHTTNPSTGNEDEIYCELVKGLGESLVSGTVPGSALSFLANKADLENPSIVTFPSKSNGMFVRESLIFRSDSNGEDLAGYAGAGLYESVTTDMTTLEIVDFSGDPIMTDEAFQRDLLSRICKVGSAIEESMGSAQDIEGVVGPDGNITVVQTRPQV